MRSGGTLRPVVRIHLTSSCQGIERQEKHSIDFPLESSPATTVKSARNRKFITSGHATSPVRARTEVVSPLKHVPGYCCELPSCSQGPLPLGEILFSTGGPMILSGDWTHKTALIDRGCPLAFQPPQNPESTAKSGKKPHEKAWVALLVWRSEPFYTALSCLRA